MWREDYEEECGEEWDECSLASKTMQTEASKDSSLQGTSTLAKQAGMTQWATLVARFCFRRRASLSKENLFLFGAIRVGWTMR